MTATPLRAPGQTDAIARRYCFAAWPQTCAHASWFAALDDAVGLKVSRDWGRWIGAEEQAVAQALLREAGADLSDRVAVDRVPLWAMQAHEPMRRHLSTVAALGVLPALRLAVRGADARQWDSVLGADVRHAALLLSRTNPEIEPPPQAGEFRRCVSAAAKTTGDWERFCLGLGLAALVDHGPAVHARVRLAWPHGLKRTQPLEAEEPVRAWLVEACMKAAQLLHIDQLPWELAA